MFALLGRVNEKYSYFDIAEEKGMKSSFKGVNIKKLDLVPFPILRSSTCQTMKNVSIYWQYYPFE